MRLRGVPLGKPHNQPEGGRNREDVHQDGFDWHDDRSYLHPTSTMVNNNTNVRTNGILSERCCFISTSKEDHPPTRISWVEPSV